jgi:hypothetical protein
MRRHRTIKIAADAAPRCLARTRRGEPCLQPVVVGKKRCRMHGGAAGSGAPVGNKNRLVHGRYSASTLALGRLIRGMLRTARSMN